MTPRTTVTPRVPMPPAEKALLAAISAARMQQNAEKKIAAFVAKLSPSKLVRYNALDPMTRGMAALNGTVPKGEKNLPADNSAQKMSGSENSWRNKKQDISFDAIAKAAKSWGREEFTANAIFHALSHKRCKDAVRRSIEKYVSEGKLVAITGKARKLYKLAVQS